MCRIYLKVEHIQFTDSSSARQLASRQGCGKVRHLSGKILWIQKRVNDGFVLWRQIPTAWNCADIGTKSLSQQRLLVLMHECGLIFISNGERVGAEQHQRQVERHGNQRQLQQIAKTILRMNIAMGLGPVEVVAQQCGEESKASYNVFWIWITFGLLLGVMILIFTALWRKWKAVAQEIEYAQTQRGDHYE